MQRRTRHVITVVVAFAAAAAVAFAVYVSLDPNRYFFRRPEDRAMWTYDPRSVAMVCSFMLLEALVILGSLIATRPRPLWLRCLIGLVVLGPSLASTMVVIHMPGYVHVHHLWVWLLVLSLAVVVAFSAARRVYSWFREPGEAP